MPTYSKAVLICWLAFSLYISLDRYFFKGRLNYLMFGRAWERVRSFIHEKTEPRSNAPATEATVQIEEDIAPTKSYTRYLSSGKQDSEPPQAPPPVSEPQTENNDSSDEPPVPAEPDEYDAEEAAYLRRASEAEEEDEPQPGVVDMADLCVLLSVFSKREEATREEVIIARRAMRGLSGSFIEKEIIEQLNDKGGYVATLLDAILKEDATTHLQPSHKARSTGAFQMGDYIEEIDNH